MDPAFEKELNDIEAPPISDEEYRDIVQDVDDVMAQPVPDVEPPTPDAGD